MWSSASPYDTIIVGAGVGGLACGARLAKAGQRVLVLEANDEEVGMGGRCGGFEIEAGGASYRFDAGPSLLLLPDVYEETFEDVGTVYTSGRQS